MPLEDLRAARLAAGLDLHVDDIAVCLPCLSLVAFPLDSGDMAKVRRETRYVTPTLWEEGLGLPVRLALERARRKGVPDTELGLRDVELNGGRGKLARAVVQLLAAQLVEDMHARRGGEG